MTQSRDEIIRRAASECKTRHRVALRGSLATEVAGKLNGVHEVVEDPEATVDVAFIDVHTLGTDGTVQPEASLPKSNYNVGVTAIALDSLSSLFSTKKPDGIRIDRLICAAAVIDFTNDGLVLREVANDVSGRDVQQALGVPVWASHDLKPFGE